MFRNVIVGLFALWCIDAANKEGLLALRHLFKCSFRRSWIVRLRRNRRCEGPANARVKQLQANPPPGEIGVLFSEAVDLCQVVEGRVLDIEANATRRGDKA